MSTRTILIIEGDVATGERLHAELRSVRGWVAAVAPDAATARRLLREIRFDVLVLDGDLPDLGGLELLTLLLSAHDWHEPPVILTSANQDQPGVRAAIASKKVARVLAKPFAIDVLVAAVRDSLA